MSPDVLTPEVARKAMQRMVAHTSDDLAEAKAHGAVRYVGRGAGERGKFGNPFVLTKNAKGIFVESREEAVKRYCSWIMEDEQAALAQMARVELRGKILVCHCQKRDEVTPACHAEVLVRLANPELAAIAADVPPAPARRDFKAPSQFFSWLCDIERDAAPRVLIAGDRAFTNAALVEAIVRQLPPEAVLIEGEAKGADTLAAEAGQRLGRVVAGFPAQWGFTKDASKTKTMRRMKKSANGTFFDAAAGPVRNEAMKKARPSLVIVLHSDLAESTGSKDMAMRAYNAGLPVVVVSDDGTREKFMLRGPDKTPEPTKKGAGKALTPITVG